MTCEEVGEMSPLIPKISVAPTAKKKGDPSTCG